MKKKQWIILISIIVLVAIISVIIAKTSRINGREINIFCHKKIQRDCPKDVEECYKKQRQGYAEQCLKREVICTQKEVEVCKSFKF